MELALRLRECPLVAILRGLRPDEAEGIGAAPSLLVGTNTAGGTTAKVISPQSIAIAAGAVGLNGRESEIMRRSIAYSLGMLAVVCVWTFVLALV